MKFWNCEAQKNEMENVYIFAFFICLLQPNGVVKIVC